MSKDGRKNGTEAALRESELRYRQLFEGIGDAVMVADSQGRFLDCNEATLERLGYSREEFLGLSAPDVVHPDFHQVMRENQARIWASESTVVETTHRCKDGSVIPVEVHTRSVEYQGQPAILAVVRDITERKAAEQELVHSREQMRALATRLRAAREQARKRVAREIHDDIGHSLTALRLDVAWLNRRLSEAERAALDVPAFHARLESMAALLEAGVESVRRIVTEMRPSILDIGLVEAIEWQARDFQARTGIRCKIVSSPEAVGLGDEVSTSVFRVFQEILDNVARHAQATEVLVSLAQTPDALVLSVRDNGKGITEAQVSSHDSIGLVGMRERALAFGGEVSIIGSPGQGTTVIVHIPGGGASR